MIQDLTLINDYMDKKELDIQHILQKILRAELAMFMYLEDVEGTGYFVPTGETTEIPHLITLRGNYCCLPGAWIAHNLNSIHTTITLSPDVWLEIITGQYHQLTKSNGINGWVRQELDYKSKEYILFTSKMYENRDESLNPNYKLESLSGRWNGYFGITIPVANLLIKEN